MSRGADEADAPSADHGEHSTRDSLVVGLAQSFSDRHRRGEKPTIEEYVARHPDLEAEIRELFPMLCVLEELGPANQDRGRPGEDSRGPPKQLGEYHIIREIGRGGMGVVYEAEQESLKRRVALKVLPFQSFHDEQQLERFRREAQAAARLHHTAIVPVFGVGEDAGVHYYVMQFIRGQTLAQVLQEVRRLRAEEGAAPIALPEGEEFSAASVARTLVTGEGSPEPGTPAPRETRPGEDSSTGSLGTNARGVYYLSAARMALQVAEALAYAHGEGILHRDIKPSNLLLDLRGSVWITDFGLAKVAGSGELTASGSLVGTIRYMPPERFRGAGDARSDVYSLGITLYEVITLRPAFAASDRAEVMRDVTGREPTPPRRIDPSIPRDLETIVLKAIAKEPQHRYAGASALADDLRRFIHREPVSARRASPPERLWRWAQRNPALATSTGLIALLLVALAAGGIVSAARQRAAFDEAQARLVKSKLEEGRAWRLSGELGARARSLAALREAVTPATADRVRNEVIGALALVDLEEVSPGAPEDQRTYTDEFLSSTARLLPGGAVEVRRDPGSGAPPLVVEGTGMPVLYLIIAPGGGNLFVHYRGRNEDHQVLWQTDPPRRILEEPIPFGGFRVGFDRRGERVAHWTRGGAVVVRSLPSGDEEMRLDGYSVPEGITFDPSSRRLAVAGAGFNGSTVRIHDLESRRIIQQLHHPHRTSKAAWHPDGRIVAVGCHDFRLHVWDLEEGKRLRVLEGHEAEVTRVAFSHGGRFLASAGWDNRTILRESQTGDLLTRASGTFNAFSRDDRALGFDQGSRSAEVWRLSGGECYRTLDATQVGKGPRDVDISADGRWLAASLHSQGVRLWSLDDPDVSHLLEVGLVHGLRFQRDGAALWLAAEEGLLKCPISRDEASGVWSFGPPRRLHEKPCRDVAITADGRRVASVAETLGIRHVLVQDPEGTDLDRKSFGHLLANRCDISPSGRWLASATFQGKEVRVWDLSDGSVAREFEVGTASVCFSPDERFLAISRDSWVALQETGTWNERFRVKKDTADLMASSLRFTSDGRFLVAGFSRSLVVLLRVEDGGEVARFEAPPASVQISEVSMDDGQRFLAAASTTHKVLLWDLRAVRLELRALGLDWSERELLSSHAPEAAPRLRIDAGGRKAAEISSAERAIIRNKVMETHSRRVELDPGPESYSARAAALEALGDWRSMLWDVDRVLEADPGNAPALLRRAMALDRLGRKEEAAEAFERVIAGEESAKESTGATGKLPPAHIMARRARARHRTSAGLGEVSRAWEDWKDLLERVPGDVEASAQLAWLWVVRRCTGWGGEAVAPLDEDAALALASAEAVLRVEPGNPLGLRNLGAVQVHLGRHDEARSNLRAAWERNPRMVSASLHLAIAEHQRGEKEEARRILEGARKDMKKYAPESPAQRQFLEAILACAERILARPPQGEKF